MRLPRFLRKLAITERWISIFMGMTYGGMGMIEVKRRVQ